MLIAEFESYENLTQAKTSDKQTGFTLETMPDEVTGGLLALAEQYERDGRDGDA